MPPKQQRKAGVGFGNIIFKWGAGLGVCAFGLITLLGQSEGPSEAKPVQQQGELSEERSRGRRAERESPEERPARSADSADFDFPQVAASIAVHPPKFHHVGHFLSEYVACPPAQKAMSICVVFSDSVEEELFRKGLNILYPEVQDHHWMSALADVNSDAFFEALHIQSTNSKQVVAAWKKWFGVAYLMDLGDRTPQYGLMLDAEVALYNKSDCGPDSKWNDFYRRVREKDDAKLWPTAQLSKTIKREPIGNGQYRTGYGHGQGVLKGNLDFITHGGLDARKGVVKGCLTEPCLEVNKQIDLGLFTWWTELPFVNLEVAKRMLHALNQKGCPHCYPDANAVSYKQQLRGIRFPRFEYICYQMYCILHEGWKLWDLTNFTGMAKWGSFLEDPQGNGADLTQSTPLWVSAECVVKAEAGHIKQFSKTSPPVLAFHIDHDDRRFGSSSWQHDWKVKVPGFEAFVAFDTREHNTAHGDDLSTDINQEAYKGQTLDQCKQRCLEDKQCKCITHGRKERKFAGD